MSAGEITVDCSQVRIDPAWALRIPVTLALRRKVLPFAMLKKRVYVACTDPNDTASLEAVARFTGCEAVPVRVGADDLQRALSRVYGDGRNRTQATPRAD